MASPNNVSPSKTSTIAESDTILNLPNGIAIRRYRESDIPAMSRHGNSRNVQMNLRNRIPYPYTEERAKWWVNHNVDASNHVRCGPWTLATGSQGPPIPANYAITLHQEFIGTIGLEFGAPEDVYARTAGIGYWLGEEHWGKGIMSVVVPAFVKWSWETFGILVRLDAEVYERNLGSRKCLEKAGFEFEGIKKRAYMKHGEVGNLVVLGAVRPDTEV